MVSMYYTQQSIQEAEALCLKARIRDEGVIAGHEGERDIAMIGSLRAINWLYV